MLRTAFDKPACRHFQPWMFSFMLIILDGRQYYDWAQILSDNIRVQLKEGHKTRKFFFTSYGFWVATRSGQFPRLQTKWTLGEEEGQNAVWEYYTQLPLKEPRIHYNRINDTFWFPIIIRLIGDTGFRLSKEAMELVKKWGFWFIQNSRSTYLRVSGFTREPFLLPRYCIDRIILLEYARQMVHLQNLLSARHKTGVTSKDFPLNLSFFPYPNIHMEKTVEQELQELQLKAFNYARQFYDPYNKLKGLMPKVYHEHQPALEDFGLISMIALRQWRNFIIASLFLK